VANMGVDIPEKAWREAERRAQVVRPLMEAERGPRRLIQAAAATLGLSERQTYTLLRRCRDAGGALTALLPATSTGGRGKSRLPVASETALIRIIREIHLTPQHLSAARVVLEVTRRCQAAQLRPPSPSTIRRRLRKLSLAAWRQQQGEERPGTQPLHGRSPTDRLPLDPVQIDDTPVDRGPIGGPRPEVGEPGVPEDMLSVQHAYYLPPSELEPRRRVFEETQNPLYVWEAIFFSTRPDAGAPLPALPEWCMLYLRDVAVRMFLLSRGLDFRDLGRFTTDAEGRRTCIAVFRCVDGRRAVRALGEALGLTSKSKNFFGRRYTERALDSKLGFYEGLVNMGKSPTEARKVFLKEGRTDEEMSKSFILVDNEGNPAGYKDDRSVKRMLAAARRVNRRERYLRGLPDPKSNAGRVTKPPPQHRS
jgi:hypothetical protein